MTQQIRADIYGLMEDKGMPVSSDEESFVDDHAFDSMDMVELIFEVEKKFNIKIADEDVELIKTVGDLVGYVDNKIQSSVR